LLSGKGLGGVADKLTGIGSSIAGIFGSAGKTAGDVAGTVAGTAGDVAGSAGKTAASVAGKAAGALNVVGAIGGVVSAVSGIIGNFQTAKTNDRLWDIEINTRVSSIHLEHILNSIHTYLATDEWGRYKGGIEVIRDAKLPEIRTAVEYLHPRLDALVNATQSLASSVPAMLQEIVSRPIVVNVTNMIDGQDVASVVETRIENASLLSLA
jgi:hypothetical protein